MDPNNFITKHWLHSHNNMTSPPNFRFTVVRLYRDPLSRSIDEALMIEKADSCMKIMNSKSEWSSGKITRITVEKSSWEVKKLAREIHEQEDLERKNSSVFKKEKKLKVSFEQAIRKLRNLQSIPQDTRTVASTTSRTSGDIRNFFWVPGESIKNDQNECRMCNMVKCCCYVVDNCLSQHLGAGTQNNICFATRFC